MDDKLCSKCKVVRPLTDFYNNNRTGGKRNPCKICQDEHVKQWYAAHPERRKEIWTVYRRTRPSRLCPRCPTCNRYWRSAPPESSDTPQPLTP